MNTRYLYTSKPNNNEQTIFLTATNASGQQTKIQKSNTHSSPSQYLEPIQQIQSIKKSILGIIMQFKSMQNHPQISHLFNQILYGLDTSYSQKKNIDKITNWIHGQMNTIKLNRLLNRLKNLKRDVEKLKVQKTQKNQIKTNYKHQGFTKFKLKPPKSISTELHHTLPNQSKQNQQWKQRIHQEISYRQRITKIQSQSQKHFQNKQKFLHKKLQKAKQMNKKVKQIYQKNKHLQKQQIIKHKYQQLFDPNDDSMKKRGKTINFHSRNKSVQDYQRIIDGQVSQQAQILKQGFNALKVDLQNPFLKNGISKKNIKFLQKQDDKFTKQDMITFKSLKDLMHQHAKGSKSFKSITRDNSYKIETKNNFNGAYYTPLNRSHSVDKKDKFIQKQNIPDFSIKLEEKIQLIKEKKHQLQKQRFNKIVTEAVQKQKRILRIYRKRNFESKTKINSPNNSIKSKRRNSRSFQNSPQKGMFKKVIVTRKQLLDKQRRIFLAIDNKLQNKQLFLQQRVNKVRQRLKKEQQTKEKHKQNWNQYISFTQNVSVLQSRSNSQKGLCENTNKKQQQNVIKKAYFTNLKKNQKKKIQQKLLNGLSMNDLKRKLAEMESVQAKKLKKDIIF